MKIRKINENINISDDLESVLHSINSNISKKLVNLNGADSEIEDIKLNTNTDLIDFSTINNKGRFTPIRTGRLVRRILDENDIKYIQADIEQFVIDFKAALDDSDITVVSGQDILRGYKKSEYAPFDDKNRYSSLYGSCMTDQLDFLKLYTNNKCCSLAILQKDGKIQGRGLIWDGIVDGVNRKFLDRTYSINSSSDQKLKNWAFKNGYLVVRNKTGDDGISNKLEDKNGKIYDTATIKLDNYQFDKFPYMDTMMYSYDDILTNDKSIIPKAKIAYSLRTTNGSRTIFSIVTTGCTFELVSGDDMRKWFKIENYEERYGLNYTLNRGTYEDSDLDFICKFAKLLIYITPERKLIGRCVIFKGNFQICEDINTISAAIEDDMTAKCAELGAATLDYTPSGDDIYVLNGTELKNFTLKIDKEYDNYMLSNYYLNKNKLTISNELNPIKGDLIYYVDHSHVYPQFTEVWVKPKGPTIAVYDRTEILLAEFDNKYYFREDTVSAELSIGVGKSITTHKDNCYVLDKNGRSGYVYKYDRAFNLIDFNANPEKTKWLMWCISSKIPTNFKKDKYEYSLKLAEYEIISDNIIKVNLYHYKKKQMEEIFFKKSDRNNTDNEKKMPFDMNMFIKIRPTSIQFRIEAKKGGLLFYKNCRTFKDFMNNSHSEIFNELEIICNQIN